MEESSEQLRRNSDDKAKKKRKSKKNYYHTKTATTRKAEEDDTIADKVSELNLPPDSEIEEMEENDPHPIRVVDYHSATSSVTTDATISAPPEIRASFEQLNNLEDKEDLLPEEDSAEKLLYNTRALSKHAMTYELENFEKNALIIFNQENIEGYSKPRLGTEKDVEALKRTFGNFGFEVVEHKDLTKDEVFKELKTFSESDFTDYGCVAVAVLTHGTKNGLLRAKDQLYSEVEILTHLKANDKPFLVTKPKIVIVQACRGTKSVQGVAVLQAGKIRRDLDDEVEPYFLPVESDMLVLHSSYSGNPAHRDEIYGSWFIQSLCRKINDLAPAQDLESIFNDVKREVAIDRSHVEYNRRTFELDTNKQMPVMTSTLIRKLYLRKYGDEPPATQVLPNLMLKSSHEVLDNSVPNTPLRLQFGPCSCFLDHFDYITKCLGHLVEEIQDPVARSLLEVAETLEDGVEYHATKQKMLKAICNYLMANSKDSHSYKFLYLYKN